MPDIWAERFDEDEGAQRELESRKKQIQKLLSISDRSLAQGDSGAPQKGAAYRYLGGDQ